MKAIRIESFAGNFEQVKIQEQEMPEPGPGQVRVRMQLSPVNPSDRNYIHGTYFSALERVVWNRNQSDICFDPAREMPCPRPPYTLGGEGFGIVDAAGPGLFAKRLLGKRVAVSAAPPEGTWQEYSIVDAMKTVPVGADIPDEQAAMFFVNPLSAYVLVREVLRVRKDSWLLITAAGSALGKMVVALAKMQGARTICVVRSNANRKALLATGADVVIATDEADLLSSVARVTEGKGVDCAIDCVGGELASQVMQCLALGGHLVVYGTLASSPAPLHSRDLMMPMATVSGFFLGAWIASQNPIKLLSVVRNVKKLIGSAVLRSEVNKIIRMDNVKEALELSLQQGNTGKVLLSFAS